MTQDLQEAPAKGPRSKTRRRIVIALGAVAAVALLAWAAVLWEASRIHESTDDAQVEGNIVPVLARVGGYVRHVNVVENEVVPTGRVLVEIDDRQLVARLARAEADLAMAAANSGPDGQAVAELRAARQDVQRARAEAERANSDLVRYRSLAARSIISRQQLEAAEASATSAAAQLAAATDRAAASAAQARGAESRVASARADRDEAALELSFARVSAPDSGVVAKKSVEVGQLVQPGQPLMAIVPLQGVWVVANLKETQLARVRPGQKVEIRADTYPGHLFHGHVESVSPATGAKFSLLPPDNATGNFVKVVQRIPVKIILDDEFDSARPLRPGMSVRASIRTN